MDNPFISLKIKTLSEETKNVRPSSVQSLSDEQIKQKREEIYRTFSPLVNEILDQFISACKPGLWKKGSDYSHAYCCHASWYAGPEEKFKANYDEHHEIRRCLEITLEQDHLCNPTGFKITNHEIRNGIVHIGLTREDLIRGVKEAYE